MGQMADKTSKQQKIKQIRQANILESLKDLGGNTGKALARESGAMSEEFFRQLLGIKKAKVSGDLERGQSFQPGKAMTGEYQQEQKAQKQIRFERRLLEEQKAEVERKNSELQLQLHAITREMQSVVETTPKLAKEIQIAQIISGNKPDIYHLLFLNKILQFLKDFKKNIENASIWFAAQNKRANKRNFWNQYKVQKGSALLNPETYSQRSAG